MRTTLKLDDDVAKKLEQEARRSGKSVETVVNEALRRGLSGGRKPAQSPSFVVRARPMGLRDGLCYDNVETLLDAVEDPVRG